MIYTCSEGIENDLIDLAECEYQADLARGKALWSGYDVAPTQKPRCSRLRRELLERLARDNRFRIRIFALPELSERYMIVGSSEAELDEVTVTDITERFYERFLARRC